MQNKRETGRSARVRTSRRIFEMVLFAMLGSLMFCSKIILEAFPNIHLLGMLTVVSFNFYFWIHGFHKYLRNKCK